MGCIWNKEKSRRLVESGVYVYKKKKNREKPVFLSRSQC